MAIATRTISINAAFLREIKEDHHELRQLLHHTAAMLERPTWMPLERGRLVELFAKLRDQLAMHFSLEEAYGYFEEAIVDAPHLSKRAEQLRSQHAQLFSDLCSLVEQAEQLLYHETPSVVVAQLAQGYSAFSSRLRDHEASENDMVQQAITDDLGGGG